MESRNQLIWIGGAIVVAVAVISATMSSKDEELAPPTAERDLFSFIKPLGAITAGQAAENDTGQAMPSRGSDPFADQAANRAIPEEFANKPSPADIAATEQSVREMRARGASEDEVYRARATALSADAAAQLARMESEESAWQARVNAYIAERNALAGNNAQTTDAQYAMQKLRNARFTPEEQQRLDAYEWDGVPRLVIE